MELIPTPQKVEFNKEAENKGQFIIEPLYPGYGITIGNMLRRVLLSSIPGAAITSVKIKDADHEFSSLPYVKEDVADIILNLKQVNLSIDKGVEATLEEPLVMSINKKGEGKVTAADFKCPAQVTIANPDLQIATLTDKAANLEMECTLAKGKGYLATEDLKGEKLSIGHIAVDAIFTPINQVNAKVERVRVGEMTNWDKLILEIETNNTITPSGAFDTAVDILCEQLNFLKNKGKAGQTSIKTDSSDKKEKESKKEEKEVVDEKVEEKEVKAEEEAGDVKETEEDKKDEKEKKKRGRPKKQDAKLN